MQVDVDHDLCIGCGTCIDLCPEVFEWAEEDEKARAADSEVPAELEELCQEAVESCPTDAISAN